MTDTNTENITVVEQQTEINQQVKDKDKDKYKYKYIMEEPTETINPTQSKTLGDTEINFVKNATLTSKSIGHNKYQVEIKNLTENIKELTNFLTQKNFEIVNFKTTIEELQTNMQDIILNFTQTKEALEEKDKELQTLIAELKTLKETHLKEITTHQEKHESSLFENKTLVDKHEKLAEQVNTTIDKYNELKSKYQSSLQLLEERTTENSNKTTENTKIKEELYLQNDLNNSLKTQVETVINELGVSKNETAILRTLIHEKDTYLGQLQKKYAYETPTVQTLPTVIEELEELEYAKKDNPTQPVQNVPLKMRSQRGLRLSGKSQL